MRPYATLVILAELERNARRTHGCAVRGRNDEHKGKDMPGKELLLFEMFKSVLKAQKGMRAELQDEVK